ncbi:MAG: NUDIX hydrolase [Pseudomonadota bacterium]
MPVSLKRRIASTRLFGRTRARLAELAWIAHRRQYAALPWRRTARGVEVLLITSRETRRWVIPKGWPMITLDAPDAAAQEAFEEAGVRGEIAREPIGAFRYRKKMKTGEIQLCRVDVYPLAVATVARTWPERRQRDRRWVRPQEAARMVEEPGLRRMLEAFEPVTPPPA